MFFKIIGEYNIHNQQTYSHVYILYNLLFPINEFIIAVFLINTLSMKRSTYISLPC